MIQLKDKYQIDMIRKSSKILAEMFEEVGSEIKEGISTYEIDRLCESFMKKHHVKGPCKGYMGYPNVSCTSVNDTVIHGIPNKHQILKSGDLLSLDVCIDYEGFISDSTHSYEIGRVDEKVHRFNSVVKKALYEAIDAVSRPSARIQAVAEAVTRVVRPYGYGIIRDYSGHGVGLELHEDPNIYNYVSHFTPNPRIREGMVFAIEPMITMGSNKIYLNDDNWGVITQDGSYGCHWEHTVAITENGLEILTEL